MMKKSAVFLAIFAAIFLTGSVSAQSKYATYKNDFYKYSFSYPADLLTPDSGGFKGSSPRFAGDKIEMDVYGGDTKLNSAELEKEFDSYVRIAGKFLVRKSLTKTSYEIVFNESGKIYRRKKMYLANGIYVDMAIKYDESKRNIYDKVADKIIKSIKSFK